MLWAALLVAVAVGVVATHRPALDARALTIDDAQYMTRNRLVRTPGWASAGRFFAEILEPSTVQGYYQPLTMCSLMLDCAAGGSPDNLRPFHRTSLLFQVGTTLLVAVFLRQLFGSPWVAAGLALVYGVHPIAADRIAWVADRKTVLSAFFAMASLTAYVRYARTRGRGAYAAAFLAFAAALLSKPTTVVVPVLMLILDWHPLRRLDRKALIEKTPFFLAALISVVVSAVSEARTTELGAGHALRVGDALLVLFHNAWFYLRTLAWPSRLCLWYTFPADLSASVPAVLAGIVFTLLIAVGLAVARRWSRIPLAGWIFFVVAFLPTVPGILRNSHFIAANRYVYFAAVGLLLPLAAGCVRLLVPKDGTTRPSTRKVVVLLAALGVCVAAAVRVSRSLQDRWADSLTLHTAMVACAPDAAKPRILLGDALAERGRIEEAIAEYRIAIRFDDRLPNAHNNLANALAMTGEFPGAVEEYREVLRLDPNSAMAHCNLANALAAQGRAAEAREHYEIALRLDDAVAEAHNGSANLLSDAGDADGALAHYERALELRPDLAEAHANLASLLLRLGRREEAIAHYREALRIRPQFDAVRRDLERALGTRDQ